MIDNLISQVKTELDNWYANKYIYAIPDWFVLVSQAELVALLPIYGQHGLQIIGQKVDFQVDFSNVNSILYYHKFLEDQMDKQLPVLGYVLFYNKNIVAKQDPTFKSDLTEFQQQEIRLYNQNRIKTDISCAYFNAELKSIDSLNDLG